MTLKQLLGLHCRHSNLGVPRRSMRTCVDCGAAFVFNSYTLNEIDHKRVDHYRVSEPAVKRVSRTLRWRKKA